jgi:hypothetical protein
MKRSFLALSFLALSACGGSTQFRGTEAYRIAYGAAHHFCAVVVPALPAPSDPPADTSGGEATP